MKYAVICVLMLLSWSAPAQEKAQTKNQAKTGTKAAHNPPKLPDGQPNIEGIWRPVTSGAMLPPVVSHDTRGVSVSMRVLPARGSPSNTT